MSAFREDASVPGYDALRRKISGELFVRGASEYERLRRGWDLSIDQFPALIIVPRSVADVAAGARFATESGWGVGVQSTGHGVLYPADDSLLIVTSRMTGARVDVEARRARVEAGVTWRQAPDALAPLGLAALVGSSLDVLGVAGWRWQFRRRHGDGIRSVSDTHRLRRQSNLRRRTKVAAWPQRDPTRGRRHGTRGRRGEGRRQSGCTALSVHGGYCTDTRRGRRPKRRSPALPNRGSTARPRRYVDELH